MFAYVEGNDSWAMQLAEEGSFRGCNVIFKSNLMVRREELNCGLSYTCLADMTRREGMLEKCINILI